MAAPLLNASSSINANTLFLISVHQPRTIFAPPFRVTPQRASAMGVAGPDILFFVGASPAPRAWPSGGQGRCRYAMVWRLAKYQRQAAWTTSAVWASSWCLSAVWVGVDGAGAAGRRPFKVSVPHLMEPSPG